MFENDFKKPHHIPGFLGLCEVVVSKANIPNIYLDLPHAENLEKEVRT